MRYASAVYSVVVCPSVRLSQAGTVPKRLNTGSRKQRHTHVRLFSGAKKILAKFQQGHPQLGHQIEVW